MNETEIPTINISATSEIPKTIYTTSLHPLTIGGIASGGTCVAIIVSVVMFVLCRKLKDKAKVSERVN